MEEQKNQTQTEPIDTNKEAKTTYVYLLSLIHKKEKHGYLSAVDRTKFNQCQSFLTDYFDQVAPN